MNNNISKTEAIRQVAREYLGKTNKQIQEEVLQRYGHKVGHNLIINICGSQKERFQLGGYSKVHLENARKFLLMVGSLPLCYKLLRMVEVEL